MDLLAPYLESRSEDSHPNDEYKEISFRYYQIGGKLADFLGCRGLSARRPAPSGQ